MVPAIVALVLVVALLAYYASTRRRPDDFSAEPVSASLHNILAQAQRNNLRVQMRYEDATGHETSRSVDVYQVDSTGHFHGYCHKRKEPRTFRVDRVQMVLTDGSSEPDPRVSQYLREAKSLDVPWSAWLRQAEGSPCPEGAGMQHVNANLEWLQPRWARAQQERDSKAIETVPRWFFHKSTKAQRSRLERHGVTWPEGELTKGKASDLIGLFVKPAPEECKVLKFFNESVDGQSETEVRERTAQLLLDPESLARWEGRSPAPLQKAFFALMDVERPRGLTWKTADEAIESHLKGWAAGDDPRHRGWAAFEELYEELDDPETRKDLEIKKVPMKLLLETLQAGLAEGQELEHLANDLDAVVEALIERRPSLRRGSGR